MKRFYSSISFIFLLSAALAALLSAPASAQTESGSEALRLLSNAGQSNAVLLQAAENPITVEEAAQANALQADALPQALILFVLKERVRLTEDDRALLRDLHRQNVGDSTLLRLAARNPNRYTTAKAKPARTLAQSLSITVGVGVLYDPLNGPDRQNLNRQNPSTTDAGSGLNLAARYFHQAGSFWGIQGGIGYTSFGMKDEKTTQIAEAYLTQNRIGGHFRLKTNPWSAWNLAAGPALYYGQKRWHTTLALEGGMSLLAAPAYQLEVYEQETSTTYLYSYSRKKTTAAAPTAALRWDLGFFNTENLFTQLHLGYSLLWANTQVNATETRATVPAETTIQYRYSQTISLFTLGLGLGFRF